MIIYRDRKADERQVPPWLDGASDVIIREDIKDIRIKYYGIGPAHLIGELNKWTDLGGGYDAAIAEPLSPYLNAKKITWAQMVEAEDKERRGWYVPRVIRDGVDLIIPTYDENYLPKFTEEQSALLEIAKAARSAIETGGVDISIAARWAVRFICAANYIPEQALLKLGLVDSVLVVNVLEEITGQSVKQESGA